MSEKQVKREPRFRGTKDAPTFQSLGDEVRFFTREIRARYGCKPLPPDIAAHALALLERAGEMLL